MKFESKISGTRVTNYGKIKVFPHLLDQIVTLHDINNLTDKRAVQFILNTYNMVSLNADHANGANWGAIMSYDDILKVSILENHPDLEAELRDHFGDNWLQHYIRFNH